MAKQFFSEVSATDSNSQVDFGLAASRLEAINDGVNSIFITLESNTATTSDLKLYAGERFSWDTQGDPLRKIGRIGIICASGETATVRVGAWR